MKKFYQMCYLAVATVGCVFSANADVYYTIMNASGASTSSGYQDLDTLNVKFNGNNYDNILSGGIMISQPDTALDPNNPSMPQSYLTVCTDFLGSLYLGKTYTYTAPAASFATVLGQSGGGGIDPHWNNPAYAIQNASQIFYKYGDVGAGGINTAVGGTPLTVDQMAALQVAIWIALYDTTSTGTVDLSGLNTFQLLTGDSYNAVSGYVTTDLLGLNAKTGNSGSPYNNTGYLLQPDPLSGAGSAQVNSNYDGQLPQELLMGSTAITPLAPNPSPVPEPTTVFAAVALLLPLGASTIRILRKSKIN